MLIPTILSHLIGCISNNVHESITTEHKTCKAEKTSFYQRTSKQHYRHHVNYLISGDEEISFVSVLLFLGNDGLAGGISPLKRSGKMRSLFKLISE